MKKLLYILVAFIFLTSCANSIDKDITEKSNEPTGIASGKKGDKEMYEQINAETAKKLMDENPDAFIVDAREKDEYDDGHIEGAVLIPYTQIDSHRDILPVDKDALILVYCRSGRRSKIASQSLAELGYTNIKEFGGIIDWPYDIVK